MDMGRRRGRSFSPPEGHSQENTSTWVSIDGLAKKEERLREIFGDVRSSSELELLRRRWRRLRRLRSRRKRRREKIRFIFYLPQDGFLGPESITLSFVSDTIKPGDIHYCALYTMANTVIIYLIFCK